MPLFNPKGKLYVPTTLLRDKYLVPPFSILDTSVNAWLQRRNMWEQVIKNRSENIRNVAIKKHNTPYLNAMDYDEGYKGLERNGFTSTFDPFLCEILVKWFSRQGDTIFDPFAGGHVRGAVCAMVGRDYVGIDINPIQVQANDEIWESIINAYDTKHFGKPCWIIADSTDDDVNEDCEKYDMMLTCPPYYNLEVYTDNPRDLSTYKTYDEFLQRYQAAIRNCYTVLADDAFAVIVVEEIRDKNGILYGFVPDTIRAFTDAGFLYYNEMILENRIMSLGVRCPKYFEQSRKVGRHHQNVLVFFKGNPKNIEQKFGRFTEGKNAL
jgi:DNA modification methylase